MKRNHLRVPSHCAFSVAFTTSASEREVRRGEATNTDNAGGGKGGNVSGSDEENVAARANLSWTRKRTFREKDFSVKTFHLAAS